MLAAVTVMRWQQSLASQQDGWKLVLFCECFVCAVASHVQEAIHC